MHFSNNKKVGKRVMKVCSVLLSLVLLCSMMYVGNVVSLDADAIEYSGVLYFDFNAAGNSGLRWIQGNARPAIWWDEDNADNGSEHFAYLDCYDTDKDLYVFYIPEGKSVSRLRILRMSPDSSYTNVGTFPGSSDGFWTKTGWMSVSAENNVFYANCDSMGDNVDEGSYSNDSLKAPTTAVLKGGSTMAAAYSNLENSEFKTGYGIGTASNGTELIPIKAEFYDYLTDHELIYGWRSMTKGNTLQISRYYRNRIPYKGFNSYISSLTENSGWHYPLYFGNFTSHWSSFDNSNDETYGNYSHTFTDFYYGTLKDVNMYNGSGNVVFPDSTAKTFFRREPLTSSYTTGDGLKNFSVFANDSEALREMVEPNAASTSNAGYGGSVQGLVQDTLANDKLVMEGGVESPYFSVNDYTNKVETRFPMRVERNNTTTATDNSTQVKYTTYEFNANGKNEDNKTDIVYFSYENGQTSAINYTNDTGKEVLDAYNTLGGNKDYNNGANHRGFFPFDEATAGNNIATDYGFGMRLDIDFNLTEDGNVLGQDSQGRYYNTNQPMEFTFAGDDDVWVFIDGKLALDLGGDHGNSNGGIDFSFSNPHSYINTGAVSLKPTPSYGSTEYAGTLKKNGEEYDRSLTTDYHVFSGSDFKTDNTGTAVGYNPKKNHVMTVFYMERGLVESNLKLSFSVSPTGNALSVEKKVKYDNVNRLLLQRVTDYFDGDNSENFKFTVDDGTGKTTYDMTKDDGTNTYSASYNNGVTLKAPKSGTIEYAEIKNQLKDDADIGVTETIDADAKYQYDTTYYVWDKFMKGNYDDGFAGDSGYVVVPEGTAAVQTSTTAGRSVTVPFTTNSTIQGLKHYNEFGVEATNTVKVAPVSLKKTVEETLTSDEEFTFDVYVKLPGDADNYFESDPAPVLTDFKIKVDANGTEATKTALTDVPVGSTVKFVEKLSGTLADKYKDLDSGKTSLADKGVDVVVGENGATAAYDNKKKPVVTIDAQVKAKKILNADPSGVAFDFTLTPESSMATGANAMTTSNLTKDENGYKKGDIIFDLTGLAPNSVYSYILEEKKGTDDTYTYSNLMYWVEVLTDDSTATVTYWGLSIDYTSNPPIYSKTDRLFNPEEQVVFRNSTKPTTGSLKVTKKGGDGSLLGDIDIAIVKADQNGEPLAGAAPTVKTTGDNGTVTFANLEQGDYLVYETKSKDGYELYGRYEPVTVTAGQTAEIEITDHESPRLPESGGIGVIIIILIGIALVAGGIYLLKPSKKSKAD